MLAQCSVSVRKHGNAVDRCVAGIAGCLPVVDRPSSQSFFKNDRPKQGNRECGVSLATGREQRKYLLRQ